MLNLIERNPVMGVLFSDANVKASHVHDLTPGDEKKRMENLRRIFGYQQETEKRGKKRSRG